MAETVARTRTLPQARTFTKSDRFALAAVSILALLIRLIFVSIVHPTPFSDFGWYYQHAQQIDRGLGFETNGYPTAYWPLGWPYFLAGVFAIFGTNVYAAEVTQAVLNALTVSLVFLIAQRVAGTASAVAAGISYAVLPSAVEWSSVLGTEPLYTFLWALITYIWIRTSPERLGWYALTGILAGGAALVRPTALLLWGVLLIYLFLSYLYLGEKKAFWRVLLPTLVVFVFTALTIAPDLVRNYRIFNTFILISNNGGITLWTGNNPNFHNGDVVLHNDALTKMIKDPRTELAADQMAENMAVSYMKAHPGRVAKLALPKIKALYGNDDGALQYAFQKDPSSRFVRTARLINLAFYYPMLLLALVGFLVCALRSRQGELRSPAWLLVFLNIIYNTLPFAIFPAYNRYHFPTMPYFAVFAGIGIIALLSRLRPSLRPLVEL